ncbi:hypothetical protein Tco_0659339 [Tanacetum coccineum]
MLGSKSINGSYIAKEESKIQYLEKARALIHGFKVFSIDQYSRSENYQANALSKIASTSFSHLTKQVLVEVLKEKSINEKEIYVMVEEEREAKSKAKIGKYYNDKGHNTAFKLGDFVYRNINENHVEDMGKLGLKWEGPYEVVEALGNGSYKLRNRIGDIFP